MRIVLPEDCVQVRVDNKPEGVRYRDLRLPVCMGYGAEAEAEKIVAPPETIKKLLSTAGLDGSVWTYSSPGYDWEHMCGQAGVVAITREGDVVGNEVYISN